MGKRGTVLSSRSEASMWVLMCQDTPGGLEIEVGAFSFAPGACTFALPA